MPQVLCLLLSVSMFGLTSSFKYIFVVLGDTSRVLLLSNRNPNPLGKHMNKTWEASGLTSPDGETVELASNLVIDGAVEMWLAALEGAMQTALQKLLASSLQAYK